MQKLHKFRSNVVLHQLSDTLVVFTANVKNKKAPDSGRDDRGQLVDTAGN